MVCESCLMTTPQSAGESTTELGDAAAAAQRRHTGMAGGCLFQSSSHFLSLSRKAPHFLPPDI